MGPWVLAAVVWLELLVPLCLLELPPVSRITATTTATITAARIRIPPRRELEGELDAGRAGGALGGTPAPSAVVGGAAAAVLEATAAGGARVSWCRWTLLASGAGISGSALGVSSASALDTATAQLRAASESLR